MRHRLPPLTLALLLVACADGHEDDASADAVFDGAPDVHDVGTDTVPDTSGEDTAPPRRCNGSEALCDRGLDEVVLAGTHNAMANEADGFFAPNHRIPIREQLDLGVRALLIDTYRDDDGLALCHGDCFLGRTDAIEQLGAIDAFLEAHPNEVMAFIFQDGVSMEDSVTMLEASGLSARALTPPAAGEPWPTLGEMIDSGTRVLLTHESGREGPAWFPAAWDVFVDTPYSFERPEDFTCRVNRGEASHPLRLMNHWLSDPLPRPENAERANRGELLRARAEECEAFWGAPPTIVAVDFVSIGDLMETVDALNER